MFCTDTNTDPVDPKKGLTTFVLKPFTYAPALTAPGIKCVRLYGLLKSVTVLGGIAIRIGVLNAFEESPEDPDS
jgi:hypothetical protein